MRRVVLIAVVIVVGAAVIVGVKWWREARRLEGELRRIERVYAPAIELIERSSRELVDESDRSFEAFEERHAVAERIGKALGAPAILSASWTMDGHHGAQTLKAMKMKGYSIGRLYEAKDSSGRHTLRYGKTFQGRPILIFMGWVPDGVKRHYRIAIAVEEGKQ